jgi:hypothetical protein
MVMLRSIIAISCTTERKDVTADLKKLPSNWLGNSEINTQETASIRADSLTQKLRHAEEDNKKL